MSGRTAKEGVPLVEELRNESTYSSSASFNAEKESSSLNAERETRDFDTTWQPSAFSFRPLSGLFALAVAVACMLAALGVLVASDQQPVKSWMVQPTVPLAILSAVGAGAVRYAKCSAAPIAWWHEAIHGSTVRKLEDRWQANRGLLTAITTFHRTPWMSMATFLVTIMIIDGALLQRASSVNLIETDRSVPLSILLSPELPTGFSGFENSETVTPSQTVSKVIGQTMKKQPLLATMEGCEAGTTCTGTALGPGVAVRSCQNQTWPITAAMFKDPRATWGPAKYQPFNNTISTGETVTIYTNSAFWVDIYPLPMYSNETAFKKRNLIRSAAGGSGLDVDGKVPEAAVVEIGIATITHTGSGNYTYSACTFEPAVLEYSFSWEAGVITPDVTNPRFVAWANNTVQFSDNDHGSHAATMDDVTFALGTEFNANATALYAYSATSLSESAWGLDPLAFQSDVSQYYDWGESNYLGFADPFSDIINTMNTFMFRGGLESASLSNLTSLIDAGLTSNQHITGQSHVQEQIYTTDFRWFAGAAVLDVLVVAILLPMFWGWWKLPRHLTQQSPFEMALAFDGPLVNGVPSAGGSDAVVDRLGGRVVAYGIVGSQRLGFAEQSRVAHPSRGMAIPV